MRKVLSFVLVLSMVLGSFSMAFAGTTGTAIEGVLTVADETDFINGIDFKITSNDFHEKQSAIVRLSIENGEWQTDKDNYSDKQDALIYGSDADEEEFYKPPVNATTVPAIYVEFKGKENRAVNEPEVIVNSLTQTSVELEFVPHEDGPLLEDDRIMINMRLTSGDEAGDVTVKAEGEGRFSSGSYVVARVVGGKTTATVSDSPKRSGRIDEFSAATIEIRETSIGTVYGKQVITLRLPKGVTWDEDKTDVSGSLYVNGSVTTANDDRELKITINPPSDSNARRTLVIDPVINIGKDASMGDIEVDVRVSSDGNRDSKLIDDAAGLVIAIHGEENVTVTTVKDSELPVIISGFEKQINGKPYTVEVTIEEELPDSLVAGRFIDFIFPEHVQLVAGESVTVKMNSGSKAAFGVEGNTKDDTSEFEWAVSKDLRPSRADKFTFEIPITVEAGYEGDIELTVSGGRAGVNETTLVVATAIPPVSVDVELSDVRTGVQNQTTSNIVIKENVIGAIRDENGLKTLKVELDDSVSNLKFKDVDKFEVTAGNLEIKKAEVKEGAITIEIDSSSKKTEAEITISGVEVTLDRTPAEGKYKAKVGGTAIVNNSAYNEDEFSGSAVKVEYLNVITPADANVYGEAKFVIGQSTYSVLVNGKLEERTMDVAPYVDGNSRSMVPMRYVANALGVSDDNIIWNQESQTATFFKGDRIAVITAGSNQMSVNGAIITMDTVAVVKDNRVYVPMRYVANALGGSVEWDQSTQTVTINQ